jgi:AcrR family transcriptional regulator
MAARKARRQSNYVADSIDDVADVAGVGRASCYLHFDGKERVMRTIVAEEVARRAAIFQILARNARPTRLDLLQWLDRYIISFQTLRETERLLSFIMGLDISHVALFGAKRGEFIDLRGERIPAFRLPQFEPAGQQLLVAAYVLFVHLEQLAFDTAFRGFVLDPAAADRRWMKPSRRWCRGNGERSAEGGGSHR